MVVSFSVSGLFLCVLNSYVSKDIFKYCVILFMYLYFYFLFFFCEPAKVMLSCLNSLDNT